MDRPEARTCSCRSASARDRLHFLVRKCAERLPRVSTVEAQCEHTHQAPLLIEAKIFRDLFVHWRHRAEPAAYAIGRRCATLQRPCVLLSLAREAKWPTFSYSSECCPPASARPGNRGYVQWRRCDTLRRACLRPVSSPDRRLEV
jgi:hypothetical protein